MVDDLEMPFHFLVEYSTCFDYSLVACVAACWEMEIGQAEPSGDLLANCEVQLALAPPILPIDVVTIAVLANSHFLEKRYREEAH